MWLNILLCIVNLRHKKNIVITSISMKLFVFIYFMLKEKYTSTLPRKIETLLWLLVSKWTSYDLSTHHLVKLNVSDQSIKYNIVVMLMYQPILFDFFYSSLYVSLNFLFRKSIAGCMSWYVLFIRINSCDTQWWNSNAWHFSNLLQYYHTSKMIEVTSLDAE